MSTCSTDAASGAGPSAAINPDPVCHEVVKPTLRSQATAAWTAAWSGPNAAAYVAGETIWPDAINFARRSGSLALSAKLSETVVPSPAGPRWTALRMAAARVGAGDVTARAARGEVAGEEVVFDGPKAARASATVIVTASFTGTLPPKPLIRTLDRNRAWSMRRRREFRSSRRRTARHVAPQPRAGGPGLPRPATWQGPGACAQARFRPS